MRCSKCGSENRQGRKFCRSCGTLLVAVCPKCDAAVERDEKFCGECGTALITPTRTHSSKPAEANQPLPEIQVAAAHGAGDVLDGERKTVTALFADIKDSTELLRDLDPEEARSLIDPALNLMVGAVRRYDGYVVQSTGDSIFALFDAPHAHEDHAQRALYAALDMQMDQPRTTSAARQRHPESDPDSCSVAQLLPSRLRNRLRRECDEFFARTRCDELANGARLPVGFAAPIY